MNQTPGANSVGHVTLEDVKRAIEELDAAGTPVSTWSVHAKIGRGSRTTIVKHYAAIQLARKATEPNDSTPLSPFLLRELTQELARLVKDRTSQLSAELTDVRASLELVVDENEAFRTAAAEAESRVAALQVSLAEQFGIAETLRCQGETISKQLVAVNSEAESARQALALVQEHLRASEERARRLEVQEERARYELADAHSERAELREQLEAKTRECITLQGQAESAQRLESRLEQSAAKVERLQAELQETGSGLAASEAQRSGLAERLKDAQDALSRAEATCQQLLRKVLETAPASEEGEPK
jgi:chromosome segregation ATPase